MINLVFVSIFLGITLILSAREKKAQKELSDSHKARILDLGQKQQKRTLIPMIALLALFAAAMKWGTEYVPIFVPLAVFLVAMIIVVIWSETKSTNEFAQDNFPDPFLKIRKQNSMIRLVVSLAFFIAIGLSSFLSLREIG